MHRVRAIIIASGSIALIERHRDGRHYFVFPGGGREAGEPPHDALVREIMEETGLLIEVGQEVARVNFADHIQRFYLVSIRGGEFGTGTGPEFTDPAWRDRGSYQPIWLPVRALSRKPVYPEGVAALIVDAQEAGWATHPVLLTDGSWRVP